MITVDEVIGRVGIFTGSVERNIIRPENIRKALSFNHKQFHLSAPLLLRDYLMTYENGTVQPAAGYEPKHLLFEDGDLIHAKEILSVTYLGVPSEPYRYIGSAESFAALSAYDEDNRFGRFWLHQRGKRVNSVRSGRILIWQGVDVPAAEDTLAVHFVREVDTTNYDLNPTSTYDGDSEFDCPSELIELLVLQTARDLLTEAGNKQDSLVPLQQMIQDQRTLITQLDQAKSQGLSAQDLSNRDIRL